MRTLICVALVLVVLMAELSAIEARKRSGKRGRTAKHHKRHNSVEEEEVAIEGDDTLQVEEHSVKASKHAKHAKHAKKGSKGDREHKGTRDSTSDHVVCKEECSETGASCKVVQSGACKSNYDGTLYCQCGSSTKGPKGKGSSSYVAACDGGAEGDACEVTGVCKHHHRHGHRCQAVDVTVVQEPADVEVEVAVQTGTK